MALDKVKKAAWRQRPEVQQRQRQCKRNWNQANRSHIAHYMRERRRRSVVSDVSPTISHDDPFDASATNN